MLFVLSLSIIFSQVLYTMVCADCPASQHQDGQALVEITDDDASVSVELISTDLLQRKTEGHFATVLATRPGVKINTPVYWFHIPKCNSGFGASIVLLPNMCSNFSVASYELLKEGDSLQLKLTSSLEDECPGYIFDLRSRGYYYGDHSAIAPIYAQYVKGHGLTVLRQPEQRVLSAYNDRFHSWPYAYFLRDPFDVNEYATVLGGCATKMITRSQRSTGRGSSDHSDTNLSSCGDPNPVTAEESVQAIASLRGFQFIGILEQYSLSICLFHAMFGGNCTSSDLGESHSPSNLSLYDTSVLNGWVDVYDGLLYAEGQRIFERNLMLYNVDGASCQPCYRLYEQAGYGDMQDSLLQQTMQTGLTSAHSRRGTTEIPLPVAYLHVPKNSGNQQGPA